MAFERQVGEALMHCAGGVEQAVAAQADAFGRAGAARGEGDLGGARRQLDRLDHPAHPGQALPATGDGEAEVECTDAFRLVGEHGVSAGLFERVAQLFAVEEGGQWQMHAAGVLAGEIGNDPGRAVVGEDADDAAAG